MQKFLLLIAATALLATGCNSHQTTQTQTPVSQNDNVHELCQPGTFSAPTSEELAYSRQIAEDSYVQYVRSAINDFLDNNYAPGNSSGLIDNVHYQDSAYDELLAIDKTYLKSKFIVLSTDQAPGGGESIVLIFKSKPDQVFYAWVYDYRAGVANHNQGFDLRSFIPYDLVKNNAPDIQTTQKIYINQICDPDLGI